MTEPLVFAILLIVWLVTLAIAYFRSKKIDWNLAGRSLFGVITAITGTLVLSHIIFGTELYLIDPQLALWISSVILVFGGLNELKIMLK